MNTIRDIQSSVNYPAGKATISVPFFTLPFRDVRIPVAISYNTSGIRIEDRAGEVGVGWRLAAGGKITRIVKQRPDQWGVTPWQQPPLHVAKSFFENVNNLYKNYNQIDSEPDLFFFEIPGTSGMFVLDGDGTAHTIPYQPISIQWIGDYFIIKDNRGNRYHFGTSASSRETTSTTFKNENIKNGGQESFSYTSTWHLNRINTYTGGAVDFLYTDGSTQHATSTNYTFIFSTDNRFTMPHANWKRTDETSEVSTTTSTKFLYAIRSGKEEISFTRYGSDPLYGNSIGEISYSTHAQLVKTFILSYELFAHNRVFLKDIQEKTPSNLTAPLCSFAYNKHRLLPEYSSMDYDSWGYYNYNGIKSNTTHMPDDLNLGLAIWQGGYPQPTNCATRHPNLESTRACVLTSIQYNTGGRTEYTYGLHPFVGGLRIEEIRHIESSGPPLVTRYEYLDNSGASSGYVLRWPTHARRPSALCTSVHNDFIDPFILSSKPFEDVYDVAGNHIVYKQITEKLPDGSKTIYEYATPDDGIHFRNKPGVTLRYWLTDMLDVTNPGPNVFRPGEKAPETSRFWKYGLLKRIRKTDPQGNVLQDTKYDYKVDLPNRKVIPAYIPYTISDVLGKHSGNWNFLFAYEWESQPIFLSSTTTISSNAPTVTTSYTYDTEWMAPTTVIQSTPIHRYTTTYRYAHDLTHAPSGLNLPTRQLMEAGILAPVETVTYKNDRVVSAELTEYSFVPLGANPTAVLPVRKYYLPLYSPVNSLLPVNYNGSGGLTYHPGYRLSQTLDYDPYGRIQTQHDPEGRITHFLYAPPDANGKLADEKIAEISNVSSGCFFYEGFEYLSGSGIISTSTAKTGRHVYSGSSFSFSGILPGIYRLTYWQSTDSGATWRKQSSLITLPGAVISNNGWIDEVRVHPPDARMTTRTYLPGVGISSETDHNGVTTYWEYDDFGKVKRILNTDRQVVEEYEYHLKNE